MVYRDRVEPLSSSYFYIYKVKIFKKIKIITKHEVPGASHVVEKYSKIFIPMAVHSISGYLHIKLSERSICLHTTFQSTVSPTNNPWFTKIIFYVSYVRGAWCIVKSFLRLCTSLKRCKLIVIGS